MIKAGQVYRHYKGHIYQILAVAKHSETLEQLVVYVRVEQKEDIWVRPLDMFVEKLADGRCRFELIEDVK